jgi:hypothetical protein
MHIKQGKPKLILAAVLASAALVAGVAAAARAPSNSELAVLGNPAQVVAQAEMLPQPSIPVVDGVEVASNVPAADAGAAASPSVAQVSSTGAPHTTTTFKAGATLDVDSLKLVNNQWGAPSDEKLTCAVYQNAGQTFGWYWDRQDPKTRKGSPLVMPIYPSLRIGGNHVEQSALVSFPVQLSAVQSLTSSFNYDYPVAPTGVYDLAYDMFLLDKSQSGTAACRKAEVMIWMHGTLGQPPQTYKGDFSDGYNTYALYSFVMSDGRLYSAFILKAQPQFPTQHKVDIKKLLDKLDLDPNWYIPGIELGNEIVSGSGKIEISQFSLDLNGSGIFN